MFGIDDAIIGSVGANLVGSLIGRSGASSRQNDAQAFSAQQYATRYQTTVKDMQAAGLNPMLAYSQGAGNAPMSSAPGADSGPDLAGAINQARTSSAQAGRTSAETNLINQQARKAGAEASVAEAYAMEQAKATLDETLGRIGMQPVQVAKLISETDKNVAELKNIPLEGKRLERMAEMLYQQGNLYYGQQLSEIQRTDMLKAQARLMLSQANLLNLDAKAAEEFNNLGRNAGQLKPVFDIISAIIRGGRSFK